MTRVLSMFLAVAFVLGTLSFSQSVVAKDIQALAKDDDKKKKEKDPAKAAEKKKAMFKKMDKNADSKLSKEEFLARAKNDEAKAKMGKLFARLDKDKNDSISLEEFTAAKGKKKKKDK
jgi:Ca2+-binding EF-hand superfamily protein